MDDAETATILINSAAETAKEVADTLRAQGNKVGVISPNVMRPFPADEFRQVLRHVRAVTIGDRADSYGAGGGNLSLEVRAALQLDRANETLVLSRIYGLGGKDFNAADAQVFFAQAADAARTQTPGEVFAYHGATAGRPDVRPKPGLPAIPAADVSHGMAFASDARSFRPYAKRAQRRPQYAAAWRPIRSERYGAQASHRLHVLFSAKPLVCCALARRPCSA